ncbi:MAG: radical SAM protein [Thermoplasmata archaeon M8B2D]|nr:MAG: radical SAM protein [Thermoplasmata archaeon M8B2D]
MNIVKGLLSNYFDILDKNREAKYLLCNHTSVFFNKTDSKNEKLWKIHNDALKNQKVLDILPKQSLLDLKIEIARRIFEKCCFCERRCGVDRRKKTGNCGVKQANVSSEFLHTGEESILIPSHTIFFSGCTLHCVFCQNWGISQVSSGVYILPLTLAKIIHERKNQGSLNVNWVGGDPTPNLLFILETLKECNDNIPIIWNSNMYCSIETMSILDGVVDVYLTDFKYGNDKCAKRLSFVDNYMKVVERNHIKAYINGELIIRHLVMPNHIECCSKPAIDFISKNLPNALINIMGQYRPEYHALEFKDISRRASIDEVLIVKNYADKLNLYQI